MKSKVILSPATAPNHKPTIAVSIPAQPTSATLTRQPAPAAPTQEDASAGAEGADPDPIE